MRAIVFDIYVYDRVNKFVYKFRSIYFRVFETLARSYIVDSLSLSSNLFVTLEYLLHYLNIV